MNFGYIEVPQDMKLTWLSPKLKISETSRIIRYFTCLTQELEYIQNLSYIKHSTCRSQEIEHIRWTKLRSFYRSIYNWICRINWFIIEYVVWILKLRSTPVMKTLNPRWNVVNSWLIMKYWLITINLNHQHFNHENFLLTIETLMCGFFFLCVCECG